MVATTNFHANNTSLLGIKAGPVLQGTPVRQLEPCSAGLLTLVLPFLIDFNAISTLAAYLKVLFPKSLLLMR
ncbi:MAG: hypothetical protein DHS20C10_05910 [marine bacterium B5-7]|nr:MAG: hypothetical protein DHS20C10_05910 [marine bacterium B5-7]